MSCNHEQIRCTNNVFFCLKCGAEVPSPFGAGKPSPETEKPTEAPKKAVNRTAKKRSE